MADVRELAEGLGTVRVFGLDAKATSLGTVRAELETMVTNGMAAASTALERWRGAHAETFAEEATSFLAALARLVESVGSARRITATWPEAPGRDPGSDDAVASARVGVPDSDGTSSAEPDRLDDFRAWCDAAAERLPTLAAGVNLDGVTAERTTLVGDGALVGPEIFGGPPFVPRRPVPDLGPLTTEPVVTEQTSTVSASSYVDLPDISGDTAAVTASVSQLGSWVGAVAIAFREGDERLLAMIAEHPDLADELLAGFEDGDLGAEAALVVLLAYFDVFDAARTGDEDGEVSFDDLWIMVHDTHLPPYVARAAAVLHADPQLFNLVETMNDDMDYAGDIVGNVGDGKISRNDIETFIEFNDQLAVLEQNFATFDTAASPDEPADGEISFDDLEALAGGDGELAAAATWLVGHSGAYTRLAWYERARHGFTGRKSGSQPITEASLTLLTVDQHTYADDVEQAASFVDRRFESLMSPDTGNYTAPGGMTALFDTALTQSDQRGGLMERVIAEVADDGTIHNSGLTVAFANGAAANMGIIDHHVNAPFPYTAADLPDDVRRDYLNTHDFLREVSRDAEAATRLRQGVYAYGLAATADAPGSGDERLTRLSHLGRVQSIVDVAQDNALTGAAIEEIRALAEQGAPGPTIGTMSNYAIGHVPALGTVNGIADAMGVSAGAELDWLLSQLGVTDEDAFAALTDAEQVDSARRAESTIDRAVWVTFDRFGTDPDLRAAAQGLPFVDGDGALKADMNHQEMQAFRLFATQQAAEGGLLFTDVHSIRGGSDGLAYPEHGVDLDERR